MFVFDMNVVQNFRFNKNKMKYQQLAWPWELFPPFTCLSIPKVYQRLRDFEHCNVPTKQNGKIKKNLIFVLGL